MRKLLLLFVITIPIPVIRVGCVKDAKAQSASSWRDTVKPQVAPVIVHEQCWHDSAMLFLSGSLIGGGVVAGYHYQKK